jgi:hypothetical protein
MDRLAQGQADDALDRIVALAPRRHARRRIHRLDDTTDGIGQVPSQSKISSS